MSIYSKISKINKQKLDKIEGELFNIKSSIREIKARIKDIYIQIDSLETPNRGMMKEFNLYMQSKSVLNKQKDRELEFLHKRELELSYKYQEYKKAKLEYEKIKYLEEQEIEKRVKKLKRDEQKELDEISGILFKRSRD